MVVFFFYYYFYSSNFFTALLFFPFTKFTKILDDELMVLQFIDYVKTDGVNDDAADLKEMIVFPDLASFCIPCSLPIAPPSIGFDWLDGWMLPIPFSIYHFVKHSNMNIYNNEHETR